MTGLEIQEKKKKEKKRKRKKKLKTENFEIQLYQCWGHNNITGQSNISSNDQD